MKICTKCKVSKPLSEFHNSNNNGCKIKKVSTCKSCLKNKNNVLNNIVYGSKTRAKSKGLIHNISKSDIITLLEKQNNKCALSGIEMSLDTNKSINRYLPPNRMSIDRLDHSKGYTLDNIQLVCWNINILRGKMDLQEFLNMCKRVAEYQSTYSGGF